VVKYWIGVNFFATMPLILSQSSNAFAFSNSPECVSELKKLIVPPLTHVVVNKSIIKTEITDSSNGIYSARLFVPADSPENLDKQVSIGWVNLDINSMKAYDVTNDPDNKVALEVDHDLYKKYVDRCIVDASEADATTTMCNTVERQAEKSEVLIAGEKSGFKVIGRGRLQFYSAPDERCKTPGTFILPGEKVDAHSAFAGYTSVDYFNMKTRSSASGWVKSDRLAPTGLGIAPPQQGKD
jgi:hypothetical protein